MFKRRLGFLAERAVVIEECNDGDVAARISRDGSGGIVEDGGRRDVGILRVLRRCRENADQQNKTSGMSRRIANAEARIRDIVVLLGLTGADELSPPEDD